MLETWLRKSGVRLLALVMLETWLRESRVPRLIKETFWISSLVSISDKYIHLSCLKHDCRRAGFDSLPQANFIFVH